MDNTSWSIDLSYTPHDWKLQGLFVGPSSLCAFGSSRLDNFPNADIFGNHTDVHLFWAFRNKHYTFQPERFLHNTTSESILRAQHRLQQVQKHFRRRDNRRNPRLSSGLRTGTGNGDSTGSERHKRQQR